MCRVLSRDPFARSELQRQQVTGFTVDRTDAGNSYGERLYQCENCGRVRYTPKGHPFNFEYGTALDGIATAYTRTRWDGRKFCSLGCRNDFIGA